MATSSISPSPESPLTLTDGPLYVANYQNALKVTRSYTNIWTLQDVSAKSPIVVHDQPRQSLDSARFPRLPRSSIRDRAFEREPPTAEEGFEDVGLNDEHRQQSQQAPKKRGFFAKFSDSQEPSNHNHNHTPSMSRFIPGRKRAMSGQGAELGNIDRPKSSQAEEEQGQEMQ